MTYDVPEWHHRAACRDADVELFYPERGMSDRPAMLLCFSCPVRLACLSDALRRPERSGVWGGSTGRQRSVLRALRASPEVTLELAIELTAGAAHARRLIYEEAV
jgi:WhiB family redox-sensing transcriptional regulator